MSMPRLPKGAKRSGTIKICGSKIQIIKLKELSQDGRPCLGLTDHEHSIIFIREGQSEAQALDTLVHECLHALLHLSGASNMLSNLTKTEDFTEAEEALIRVVTPHIVSLMSELRMGGK
jgi:Zn-dependent peptidase ImmA (M78 family)